MCLKTPNEIYVLNYSLSKKKKKFPASVIKMIIVYNHHFTIGAHAEIMHSAVLGCTSNMILQLIMQPVIICFLKVEDDVKKLL